MKQNYEIEQALARAVTAQTPDVLPQVLQTLNGKEEHEMNEVITMPQIVEQPARPARKYHRTLASIAALFVLVFGLYSVRQYQQANTTYATISLDVNPSIELQVNSEEKVLSATALNADAEIVLEGMDLKRVDLNVAVNAIIGSMVKNGYFSQLENAILISVSSEDHQSVQELESRLTDEVNSTLAQYQLSAAVITQQVQEDEALRALASEYQISLGKAALVNMLLQENEMLDAAKLAALPISELQAMLAQSYDQKYDEAESAAAQAETEVPATEEAQTPASPESSTTSPSATAPSTTTPSTTTPSTSADSWIGDQAAKQAALDYIGISESELTLEKLKRYEKNGVMLYGIVLLSSSMKYSIEVNASTGAIINYYTKSIHNDETQSGTTEVPTTQSSVITADEAKAIALNHAGVSESSVQKLKVKQENEKGVVYLYEVEFEDAYYEYEYEINASDGSIRSVEKELRD